jgi:uncharacterized membrane protein
MRRPGFRPTLAQTLGGLGLALLVVAYPLAVDAAITRLGVRTCAVGLVGLGVLSLASLRSQRGAARGTRLAAQLGFVGVAGAAAVSSDRTWLYLLPPLAFGVLAAVFLASLRGGSSLIERGARLLHSEAPDFIRPYCRKVTVAWSALFATAAAAILLIALRVPEWWWPAANVWVWVCFGAFQLLEFVIRKSWFRYYPGGPLDRLWSRLLPAENTAQGRLSIEHIRRRRRELGLPYP